MSAGLDNLKHVIVLMMSGRSFDHMLGGLKKVDTRINGLSGSESNLDARNNLVRVQPKAKFQGLLSPSPDHHFPGVHQQLYFGTAGPPAAPSMNGFIQSYFQQQKDADHARAVMYYFPPEKLPVLSTLARSFAVFNGWFSSIPGPTICNRAFAHYGTSFGKVGMDLFYENIPYKSIYNRMWEAGRTARIYYYDKTSSTLESVNLLKNLPQSFATYPEFLDDCKKGSLADYSFIEPNHNDHEGEGGEELASDQHPDHNVQQGEIFIASIYNAIRGNLELWKRSALLITYDAHGGIYDHVPPPACQPDGFVASAADTGIGRPFGFDRLGVRVPAVLISPWITKSTVIPGPENASDGRTFEHASIPATITKHFIGNYNQRSSREKAADTFLDLLSDELRADSDCPVFHLDGTDTARQTKDSQPKSKAPQRKRQRAEEANKDEGNQQLTPQTGPSTHVARDRWTTEDSLGHFPFALAIYKFLTDADTKPPLAISVQAPWGGGKTSLMRMVQSLLDPDAIKLAEDPAMRVSRDASNATVAQVLQELERTARATNGTVANASTAPKLGVTNPRTHEERTPPKIPSIDATGQRRVTIWFNAWKYESTEQVWAGLADCIIQQVTKRLGPVERELFLFKLQLRRYDVGKIREKIHREVLGTFLGRVVAWAPAYLIGTAATIAAFGWDTWIGAGGLLVQLVSGWFQFQRAKAKTQEKPANFTLGDFAQVPAYQANLGFIHEVVDDLKKVFELIPKKHLPMVVFIDDLDRCSPGKVGAVVEAINLFLAGEFPDCMFILGIDDEMVAAALDEAHSDVISKLPGYARSISVGWRFMDKFVQLPFVIPPSSEAERAKYVDSLFLKDGKAGIAMEARDRAVRVVEETNAESRPAGDVAKQIASEQTLAPNQEETLKRDVEVIKEMDKNIRGFNDQEQAIRDKISALSERYFVNPRDIKRFVNMFRFYYFLRAAREARGEAVPQLDQMSRWIVFTLKWPEIVRWMRRNPLLSDGKMNSAMAALERIGGKCHSLSQWQKAVESEFNLKLDQTPWLSDENAWKFFQGEATDFEEGERLSVSPHGGLW